MQDEMMAIELERQTIEQQSIINNEEMLMLRHEIRSIKQTNHVLEEKLQELNKDITDRDSTINELQN